ncbi:hypothetical protein RAS2_32350 [Phycisphaerae bacterium RAS2]|nr:hypothetical protein RAS2_32350 [Phycisphaerae bacterium RAS2]
MAIQFFCAACHQPIEVDDDAANQSVTCPYCRKVVTAPFSSDPSVRMPSGGAMREAGPLGAAPQPASGGTLSPLTHGTMGSPLPTGRNTIGWVALVFAILSVICIIATAFVYGSWIASEGIKTTAELQKRLGEIQASGQAPPSVMTASGMACLGIVAYLTALVTGIIGVVNKKQPRWPAIVAVIVVAGSVLLLCGMTCLEAMANRAGGG